MQVNVHNLIIEQFTRSLEALNNMLTKSQEFAKQNGYEAEAFMHMRLAPDMFPFSRQVMIATDIAKGAVGRLTTVSAPSFPDNETTIDQLKVRIGKTIEFLAGVKAEDFKDYESRNQSFPWYPGKKLEAKEYLVGFALPNFNFHVAMAYAILRQHGVKLGKADFLGKLDWKNA